MRFNKLQNSAVALATLASMGVGILGFAGAAHAVVAFNTFPVSYTIRTDYDFPMIDAKNITTTGGVFSTSQSDHDNGVSANAGDTVEFQVYYHNSGVAEDVATNVIIKAVLPGGVRSAHEVSASVDSDQTSAVSSSDLARGGNMTVNISGQAQTLELISGSVRHFPNRSQTGVTHANGDNLVTSSGVNIGSVQGCWDFSGFVTFRARVGSAVAPSRDLTIDKKVLNVTKNETVFQNSTFASPSDRVRFEVRVQTTGNASQTGVIVRDILPTKLIFAPGSFRQDSATVSEGEFFGSGLSLGQLAANTTRVFTFEATVAGAGVFTGPDTITNTANVRSNEVSVRQRDAQVLVQLVAGVQFTIRKTAYNLTQGVDATTVSANPADIITYTLYYKNTGQTTTNSVIIEDNIADIKELADVTNTGEALSINGVIRYAAIDVGAGVEISRTFQVKVKEASLFPLGSDLVMTNIYGNEIRIPVRKPQIAGTITPPRTGAGEWLAVAMAGFVTAGIWIARRKKAGALA